MRKTLNSFLNDFTARGCETVFSHKPELRVIRWSGKALVETAYRFARELEARHIEKGDRILICARNSPEYVAAFFGCLLRGVIVVPLDLQSAASFIHRVRQQTAPKLLLYSSGCQATPDESLPKIALDELPTHLASHTAAPYPADAINEDDLVEIIFTSGTTAEPKGVCLSHKNLLTNLNPLENGMQKYLKWEWLVHPLRFLNLLPLSHVFGQFMGLLVPPLLRGEVFFQDSLNPAEIIETVKAERISVMVATPRLLDGLRRKLLNDWQARGQMTRFQKLLAQTEGRHFLKRWWMFREIHRRFGWKFWAFVTGGATLDEELEEFWHRLGYLTVQGYGMTETAALISFNNPFAAKRGSLGKAFASQQIKVDENGEILVRGGNVAAGYWHQGATPVVNEEGWMPTGDLGAMDEAGNLYFKGRKKDTIITSAGLNIYPEDLEAELHRQPQVRDCAVLGIEGANGQEPFAVLLLEDDSADAQAIIKRANENLSDYQQMRRWLVWPDADFPRTHTTSKVKKREIAERLKSLLSGATLEASKDERHSIGALAETIARISGEPLNEWKRDANLTTDLKLDSLGRVELLGALEDEYQVELDEAAFTAATTLGDIEAMVRRHQPVAARPYPYADWSRRLPVRCLRWALLYLLILPLTRLMSWATVRGREHLRKVRAPVLFVANHITYLDAALILWALPGRLRNRLGIAMRGEELRDWRYPPEGKGRLARLLDRVKYLLVVTFFNVFPLPQESGFRRSFAFAGELIDDGYNLLVFPEGERTPDGRMKNFMKGTGLLVNGLEVEVVPVKITGLYELKQQGRKIARPGQLQITFGAPVRYDKDADAAHIAADLQQRVARL